jgi:hypothetical protein
MVGQFDQQLIRPDLDECNVIVEEAAVVNRGVFAKNGGIWQFFPQRERGFDFQFSLANNTC